MTQGNGWCAAAEVETPSGRHIYDFSRGDDGPLCRRCGKTLNFYLMASETEACSGRPVCDRCHRSRHVAEMILVQGRFQCAFCVEDSRILEEERR